MSPGRDLTCRVFGIGIGIAIAIGCRIVVRESRPKRPIPDSDCDTDSDAEGLGMRSLYISRKSKPGVEWCRRGDSNPHGLPHHPLKMACLPVPPLRHSSGSRMKAAEGPSANSFSLIPRIVYLAGFGDSAGFEAGCFSGVGAWTGAACCFSLAFCSSSILLLICSGVGAVTGGCEGAFSLLTG